MNNFLRALGATALATFAFSSHATDMGGGTLTVSETSLSYSNSLVVGVNPTNQVEEQCIENELSCDIYALTIDLPEDLSRVFPTALFRVVLTPGSDSVTGADDFDLSLLDAEGNIIANSGNLPGEVEAVAGLAADGLSEYTIRIVNWAVVGGAYSVDIELSLGAPSEDLTDEEVAAYLAENGGSTESRALLAQCMEPGVEILSDASGDGLLVPGTDLEFLNVFQTVEDDGSSVIGFQLKVDDLTQPVPNSVYFVSFRAFGDVRGVRMLVNETGAVSYESYVVGEDSDGERLGTFADGAKPALAASNYSLDGLITIYTNPTDVLLFEPGDTLEGFNAGITTNVPTSSTSVLALYDDLMPDDLTSGGRQGTFEYRSAEECDEAGMAVTSSRDLGGVVRGGATAPVLLLLLTGLGFLRRRFAA